MEGWDKQKVSAILSVLLTAVLAILAVFGYDVKIIQPREEMLSLGPAHLLPPDPQLGLRGLTNLDDLAVADLSAESADVAGGVTVGGKLLQSSTAVTLTAGMQIAPAYSVYRLSSTDAVSMTLSAPAASGQVLYLYGDDANTITVNDTNIRSTDGNAVTIGQYDVVQFISVGSEWIHVAKSADS